MLVLKGADSTWKDDPKMDLVDHKRDTFYLARRPHPGQASQQMVREVETRYSNSRASATNNTETSVQYNMVYSTAVRYR